ncbi:hypothetical protein [Halovenus salina]|uniref:Flagellin N-terminal-like domain-containing protein n=1 Tax=Halovenus salina TaxID=1510225 RepID=A0ABD5W2V5_9EURY
MAENPDTDEPTTEVGLLSLILLVTAVLVVVLGGVVGYIVATT